MDEYKAFAGLMKDMLEYKKKEAKLLFILLIIHQTMFLLYTF